MGFFVVINISIIFIVAVLDFGGGFLAPTEPADIRNWASVNQLVDYWRHSRSCDPLEPNCCVQDTDCPNDENILSMVVERSTADSIPLEWFCTFFVTKLGVSGKTVEVEVLLIVIF